MSSFIKQFGMKLKDITFCCRDCGHKISRVSALYGKGLCQRCKSVGKNNPMFQVHLCGNKNGMYGKHHSKETQLKMSKNRKGKYSGNKNHFFGVKLFGKKNGNWKGGISRLPYSFDFTNKLKLKIRKRDMFECQCCSLKENELNGFHKKLTIHHIDYNKSNNKKRNLITLCKECNCKANGNRDYWFAYYTYLMENR